MTTYEKLQREITNAMITKNTVKRDCLRSIVSEIKNQTVNAGKDLTEDIVLKCIAKSVKQHNDSIESFKAGGREDLALKEAEELCYLEGYLPKTLSEEDTVSLINTIITENKIVLTKQCMGQIMKLLPNTVDKKLASRIIGKMIA